MSRYINFYIDDVCKYSLAIPEFDLCNKDFDDFKIEGLILGISSALSLKGLIRGSLEYRIEPEKNSTGAFGIVLRDDVYDTQPLYNLSSMITSALISLLGK